MAAHARNIYVEVEIRGPVERVWELTQTPELHQRWDLRFTEIRYLPRADPAAPQRFSYATRIGMGLEIRGEGETVGGRDGERGGRTGARKFGSTDRRSLIREGSGYWKYVPVGGDGDGPPRTRFLTAYDYDVRFGAVGRLVDRWMFRPLVGWATAWSFDRLRLWVERGIDPATSMRRSLANVVARAAVAFVWAWHGVVPKLIARNVDEEKMLWDARISTAASRGIVTAAGWAELGLGLMIVLAWRARWPLWVTIVVMPLALIGVAIHSPAYLTMAFNPVSLNVATFSLAVVALVEGRDLPSAANCLRRPRGEGA
jgi:hypothetical protein